MLHWRIFTGYLLRHVLHLHTILVYGDTVTSLHLLCCNSEPSSDLYLSPSCNCIQTAVFSAVLE